MRPSIVRYLLLKQEAQTLLTLLHPHIRVLNLNLTLATRL